MQIGPQSNFPQKPLRKLEQRKDEKPSGLLKPNSEKEMGKSKSIEDLLDPKQFDIDFAGLEDKNKPDDKPKPISQFGLNVFLLSLSTFANLNESQRNYIFFCQKNGLKYTSEEILNIE